MHRTGAVVFVALGLVMQGSPVAWAQLETVDPALYAAVEALVAHDPTIANDPELTEICRQVAEATVLDPRERSAVTQEVIALQREGVDLATVIPESVREAAREKFEQVQGQMQEQLEALRASNPEAAREMELMMREGEQCMRAFESGEQYTPSPEMVEHAREMFGSWKEDMLAQGASAEYVARAESEFTQWSSGEMNVMGHEMMGQGHEMPTLEQMQQMLADGQMTPEQFEMAKLMEQGVGGGFPMDAGGHTPMSDMPTGLAYDQNGELHWVAESGTTPTGGPPTDGSGSTGGMTDSTTTPPENHNYDNTAAATAAASEVLVASHDHNSDGMFDEFHYDVNGDNIPDHAHPTPH